MLQSKAVDSLVSQENMDQLMAKMPFILGDPDVNLPAQLAQAVVAELPFMIDYVYKAVNHSIDVVEYVKADMVELENEDDEAWLTFAMEDVHIALKELQKVMAVVDATFSNETPEDVQRLQDMRKISGIGGAVLSMLGLMPDSGSENEVIFPLLRWHQSLMDGPKIAPVFEACDKLLDDVLDGPERIMQEMKFEFNKTYIEPAPCTPRYNWETCDDHSWEADYRARTETCEYQAYYHQEGGDRTMLFGGMDPTNCTSREVAKYSWETSTNSWKISTSTTSSSSTVTTVMCHCTWAASVQGYLNAAVSSWQSDEEFRTELMGVKDACSKAASTLYRLS